jgi:small-conductance mechanosensitive channel
MMQVADTVAGGATAPGLGFGGLSLETQGKIVVSVLTIVLLIVLRRVIQALVVKKLDEATLRYRWSKGTSYLTFVLGLIALVQIWFTALRSMGTFLGLLSAGLAIALKDLIADLAGWAFILWRRPFDMGDRIQIGEHAGDVVDIRIFAFTIMEIGNWVDADQSTGRVIHIPNATVFSQSVANYTASFPFVWNELPVMVTFESDWRRAKAMLLAIVEAETSELCAEAERTLRETSKRFLIHYKTLTPTVYTSVADSGVVLTIRYLCRPRRRRGSAEALWERTLDAFTGEDRIDLAYPTQRVRFDPMEDGPG